MKYFEAINGAIKTMHYKWGIGDIVEIKHFADGRIEVTAKCHGMKHHIRRGSITGEMFGKRTIKIYRHQMTITVIGR